MAPKKKATKATAKPASAPSLADLSSHAMQQPLPKDLEPAAVPLGEDGPVSSRTRHGGKDKKAMEISNAAKSKSSDAPSLPPPGPFNTIGSSTQPFDSYLALHGGLSFDPFPGIDPGFDPLAGADFDFNDLDPEPSSLHQLLSGTGKKSKAKSKKLAKYTDGLENSPILVNDLQGFGKAGRSLTKPKADRLQRPGDDLLETLVFSGAQASEPVAREARQSRNAQQKALQALLRAEVDRLKCKCGLQLVPNAKVLMYIAREWLQSGKTISYVTNCRRCESPTCLDCGATDIAAKHKCKPPTSGPRPSACLIVWILLCGLDESIGADVVSRKSSTKRKRKGTVKGNAAWAAGTGYGGTGGDGWGGSTSSLDSMLSGETSLNDPQRTQVNALTKLSEHIPPLIEEEELRPFVLTMLRKSRLQKALAQFLETDSLHTVSKETPYYMALLKMVGSLLACDDSRTMILEARPIHFGEDDLLHSLYADITTQMQLEGSEGHSDLARADGKCREVLASALRRLHKTCLLFESNAERNGKATTDKGTKEMLKVCQQLKEIVALTDSYEGSPIETDSQETKDQQSQADWDRANCLLDVPDGTIHKAGTKGYSSGYYFSTNASAGAKPRPGRMKHLLTEVVMLQTSLPPGIFVRHEESRPDIMKFLIIGPKGTPYEHGAFEFDLYCPDNYPTSPPMVQFKQTGGGTESMNPNLYPDGKVCLSLLGTWQGQPWIPGTSTILQVLLSLQAMVLCDEPYYNEPGWSSHKNDGQSKAYNRNIYRATTQVAILQWLEAMEERQKGKNKSTDSATMWDDVLLHHFATNAEDIVKTLKRWEATIEQDKREAEEAAAAAAAAASKNASQSSGAIPPPMPNQWAHMEVGKKKLSEMIVEVEKLLPGLINRAVRAGIAASGQAEGGAQQAIKSPVELSKHGADVEEDDGEMALRRTRSKRRKKA